MLLTLADAGTRQASGIPCPEPAAPAAGSLLHRLLRDEIRRERSHLLQAFRFMATSGCAEPLGRACNGASATMPGDMSAYADWLVCIRHDAGC